MALKTKPLTVDFKKGEELIKKTEVPNSPFMIISTNNKHFGVLGKYRITELYDNFDQCKKDVVSITWNRIIQVVSLVNEIFNETKK